MYDNQVSATLKSSLSIHVPETCQLLTVRSLPSAFPGSWGVFLPHALYSRPWPCCHLCLHQRAPLMLACAVLPDVLPDILLSPYDS